MRVVRGVMGMFYLAGAVCIWPLSGWAAFQGKILVYARESSNGTYPPPITSAKLNGNPYQLFGTNDLITFSGTFEAGTQVVEVSTEAIGYVLRQSATDPNAVNDPYSEYGNPRYVTLSESTNSLPVSFQFDPVITASAVVRDAWTMERLDDAAIEFDYHTAAGTIAITKYPWTAVYATNWTTDSDGAFPTNTILYLADYDLTVTRSGYRPFFEANVITNGVPGAAFNLGTILLEPADDNSNRMADAWEAAYFGAGSTVATNADADGDGLSNRDEYISGTDPTNSQSRLWVESVQVTNGLALIWPSERDRTYRICGSTNLTTNTWVQVGGPWEADSNQYEMLWVETNMDLSWNSNYRVEVVPSWWQGTNQVLINTNRPALPAGDGSYTNGPPVPGG